MNNENRENRNVIWIGLLLLGGVLVVAPYIINQYTRHIFVMIFVHIMLAIGFYIPFKAGEVSFGQSAFAAVGGYTMAILATKLGIDPWVIFPLAGIVTAGLGLLLGLIIVHLEKVYFVLSTFAFMEFLFATGCNFKEPFGGPDGIRGVPAPAGFSLFADAGNAYYYLSLILVVLAISAYVSIDRSRIGLLVRSVGDNKVLASCSGVNVKKYKLMAFGMGCFVTGVAGALVASYFTQISPFNFGFWESLDITFYTYFGGPSSIFGPIIGAVVLTIISELMFGFGEYKMIVYGVLMSVVILGLPGGMLQIIQMTQSWVGKVRKRRA
jgi:branched-chain amino acid transport system permease protein